MIGPAVLSLIAAPDHVHCRGCAGVGRAAGDQISFHAPGTGGA